MGRTYAVGLIGVGAFGQFLLRAYQQMPEVEVRAIAAAHPERARAVAQQFGIPRFYAPGEALLEDPEIEGVALLDATNPSHVLARSPYPVMSPQKPYERLGQGVNIVFSCGALLRGEELWLYYGAADTCIGLAFVPVRELVRENHRPV
jgi:hypothetical protein